MSRRQRFFGWVSLYLLPVLAIVWVAIPVFKIMPFSAQTASDLKISYYLRGWSTVVTIVALVAATVLLIWLWRGTRRWWVKPLLILPVLPLLLLTWFTRQNHFEWMFAPLARADYARIGEVDYVADDEMVLAVKIGADAVAFPVRQVAYHHVVQDTVGGVPLVATY